MNLNEENRDGYLISAEMKKIWAVEMEIARHILDVCKRHGLKIWAEGGTLLGVVRHHGFIPWDDDIDFMMMRDDYEKLIKLADSEFKHPFFLQCAQTEKNYFRGHIQVRYDGTAAILPDDINQTFHQGIFVDIFVYDNVPEQKSRKWKRSLRNAKWSLKCLQTAYYKSFNIKKPFTTVKYIISKTLCLLFGSMNIFNFFVKQFTKWNQTESKYISSTFYPKFIEENTKEKKWYDGTVMMPFEDMDIPVPIHYHEILSCKFGKDYMTPRKVSTLHGGVIVYTDKSYETVLAELRNQKR